MVAPKPSMFIGSSLEGKRVAETIQMALEYEAHSTVWHQGVFGLSGGTLESLVSALNDYDFATLVLTADDLLEKRNASGRCPRDNVLFELGLFMGALGRSRTFIVHSRTTPPMLPTDLAGITPATYEERPNLEAALGPACTKIKRALEANGSRVRLPDSRAKDSEISKLNQLLTEQHSMVTEVFRRLTASPTGATADPAVTALDFLEGAWLASPVNSHAYCRITGGKPCFVYCWGDNSEAIGEYYDFRRIGDEILGRFRWFKEEDIRGLVWLKIDNTTRLSGAWWMEQQLPPQAYSDPELLKVTKGMNRCVWTKQPMYSGRHGRPERLTDLHERILKVPTSSPGASTA
jgi:hypothetical protein